MVRISKNPEERRNELLDTAEELFINVGYNKTSINDIVKKISVAQGTFYYYFKSKEEIFIAIFQRRVSIFLKDLSNKLSSCSTSMEKLKKFIIFDIQNKITFKNEPLVYHLHEEQNAGLHQKVIVTTIASYLPILSEIIKQGIDDGLFKTDYPQEIAEFYLINSNFGFDPGIFNLSTKHYHIKFKALFDILEKTLNLPKGSIDITELFGPYLNSSE